MIELNDPHWTTLNGGYRLPYDGINYSVQLKRE